MSWIELNRPVPKSALNTLIAAYNERIAYFTSMGLALAPYSGISPMGAWSSTATVQKKIVELLAGCRYLLKWSLPVSDTETVLKLRPWYNDGNTFFADHGFPEDLFETPKLGKLYSIDLLRNLYRLLNDHILYPSPYFRLVSRYCVESTDVRVSHINVGWSDNISLRDFQAAYTYGYLSGDTHTRFYYRFIATKMKFSLSGPLLKSTTFTYCWAGYKIKGDDYSSPLWSATNANYNGTRKSISISAGETEKIIPLPFSESECRNFLPESGTENAYVRIYPSCIYAPAGYKNDTTSGLGMNHRNIYTTMNLSRAHFPAPDYRYLD